MSTTLITTAPDSSPTRSTITTFRPSTPTASRASRRRPSRPDGITVGKVTEKSFETSWNPVDKAEFYAFQAILTHKAQADEHYALIDEPFDFDISGTREDPFVNTIGMYDMDAE